MRLDGIEQVVLTTGTPGHARSRRRAPGGLHRRHQARRCPGCRCRCSASRPTTSPGSRGCAAAGADTLGMHLEAVEPAVRARGDAGQGRGPGRALPARRSRPRWRCSAAARSARYLIAGLGDAPDSLVAMAGRAARAGRLSVPGALRAHRRARRSPTARPAGAAIMQRLYERGGRPDPRGTGLFVARHEGRLRQVRRLLGAVGLRGGAGMSDTRCPLCRHSPADRAPSGERALLRAAARDLLRRAGAVRRRRSRRQCDDARVPDRLPGGRGDGRGGGVVRIWEEAADGRLVGRAAGRARASSAPAAQHRARGWCRPRWAPRAPGAPGGSGPPSSAPNVAFFRRLHWRSLEEIELLGAAHHLMQAELARYPPTAEPRPRRPAGERDR